MNAFQILDKNNVPIKINTLDEQVCKLVGNEIDPKNYCILSKREDFKSKIDFITKTSNWFDTIGWMLSKGESFKDILAYYADIMKDFIGQIDEDGAVITLECIYPYHTKILNYWIYAGYTAKQIVQ